MSERLFEHTPLPWEVVPATEHHGPYITTRYGTTVCDLYGMNLPTPWNPDRAPKPISHTDAEKNAAAIVRACNSFDDMLTALKEIVAQVTDPANAEHPLGAFALGQRIADARAAIAKAEAA